MRTVKQSFILAAGILLVICSMLLAGEFSTSVSHSILCSTDILYTGSQIIFSRHDENSIRPGAL